MKRNYRKKLKIENATAFKLEYYVGGSELKYKEFKSLKVMEQFHKRQKDFMYLDYSRYALINNEWHRFIKLKSPVIFERDLTSINKFFYENFEDTNLQN